MVKLEFEPWLGLASRALNFDQVWLHFCPFLLLEVKICNITTNEECICTQLDVQNKIRHGSHIGGEGCLCPKNILGTSKDWPIPRLRSRLKPSDPVGQRLFRQPAILVDEWRYPEQLFGLPLVEFLHPPDPLRLVWSVSSAVHLTVHGIAPTHIDFSRQEPLARFFEYRRHKKVQSSEAYSFPLYHQASHPRGDTLPERIVSMNMTRE